MDKPPGKGQRDGPVERPADGPVNRVVIVDVPAASALVGTGGAVLVAGSDAAAVGGVVAALRAGGADAAGWIGDPSDEGAREMALELFPGAEVDGP